MLLEDTGYKFALPIYGNKGKEQISSVLMMEICISLASSFGALDQTAALSRTFQSAPVADKLAQSDHIRSESHCSPVLPSMIYCGWCLPGDPVILHAGSNSLPCLPVPPPPNRTSPGFGINRIRTGCWSRCRLSLISSILSSCGQVQLLIMFLPEAAPSPLLTAGASQDPGSCSFPFSL